MLDAEQQLLGVVSFRELFAAPGDATVRDVMHTDLVTVPEEMDQEAVSHLFARHDLLAIPVVDAEGRMKGIVTVDDIVDVVQEEATEDIQKIGGTEALDAPYLQVALRPDDQEARGLAVGAVPRRDADRDAPWRFFEDEIARAVVLALFVPLIISSGGNSGSQASTLVIRAMALGEVRLRDWWRVVRRELAAGLALGAILGAIGLAAHPALAGPVRDLRRALPADRPDGVGVSLVGVVLWGTLAGSMLPFLLAASASTPRAPRRRSSRRWST